MFSLISVVLFVFGEIVTFAAWLITDRKQKQSSKKKNEFFFSLEVNEQNSNSRRKENNRKSVIVFFSALCFRFVWVSCSLRFSFVLSRGGCRMCPDVALSLVIVLSVVTSSSCVHVCV